MGWLREAFLKRQHLRGGLKEVKGEPLEIWARETACAKALRQEGMWRFQGREKQCIWSKESDKRGLWEMEIQRGGSGRRN